MEYVLGLIGHPDINKEVKILISRHFDNIKIIEMNIIDDTDLNLNNVNIRLFEKKCMGILFTAKDIYQLFCSITQIGVDTACLEDNKSEILKTLFTANNSHIADITNISIDSITYDEIKDLYRELGLAEGGDCQILTVPFNISSDDLVEKITSAHKENYDKFSSTCITFFTETKNRLESINIPVLKVGINKDEVIKRVNELISKIHSNLSEKKSRIAILIMLSGLKEHLLINNSEYNFVTEYNRISEVVFWFSEKIDGAYIPNDQRKYIIFSNKEKYEQETDFSANISVLNEVAKKNYFYCNIGIGYGITDREAIKNATIAQIKSSKDNRSSAYIMYDSNKVMGPILPSTELNSRHNTIYDVKLNEIASKSQIGISTIYKLYNIVNKTGDSDYTSRDISQHLGITIRSSNRLFAKLTKSGYIKMVGEKSTGEKGRPIRVFRFLF
jgi:hypothetical protein